MRLCYNKIICVFLFILLLMTNIGCSRNEKNFDAFSENYSFELNSFSLDTDDIKTIENIICIHFNNIYRDQKDFSIYNDVAEKVVKGLPYYNEDFSESISYSIQKTTIIDISRDKDILKIVLSVNIEDPLGTYFQHIYLYKDSSGFIINSIENDI
jgi:hypothetical protein